MAAVAAPTAANVVNAGISKREAKVSFTYEH